MPTARKVAFFRLWAGAAATASVAAWAGPPPLSSGANPGPSQSAPKPRGDAAKAGADATVGSVYLRYASLRDLGFKELSCRIEATVKRFEAKKANGEKSTEKAPDDKPSDSSAVPTVEALNEALKASSLTLSMKPAECVISDASLPPAAAANGGSSVPATEPTRARLVRAVADALQAECAKLSLHYFRHPLADYGKDHKLKNEAGWYRLNFASGDYKLSAFVSPDLRTMREYSDGKDNLTDILFRQEGDRLAPAMISVKTPSKTLRMDGLSYELKKGVPIVAGYRSTMDDADRFQEFQTKLVNCRLN